jgi:acid phosphatase
MRADVLLLSLRNRSVLLAVALAAVVLGGCGGPNISGNTNIQCRALAATSAQRPTAWQGSVFTIVMENKNRDQIVGGDAAPFINSLAQSNAVAAGYHDSYVHPSEPNYIWMVAGENFGILNDDDPSGGNTIDSRSHLADQIEKAGLEWRSYQESMGEPCGLRSHDSYAVKHNPFVYFSDVNGWDGTSFQPSARCTAHVVDYSQLDADLASGHLPDYVFITPNLDNDMHDGSIGQGDAWLSREVPKILASDSFKNGGVLFLVWDEGDNDGDIPPFLAISPQAKSGFVSHTDYDTSAFLKTVQTMLGLETLPCATQPSAVSVMSDLFTAPMDASGAGG